MPAFKKIDPTKEQIDCLVHRGAARADGEKRAAQSLALDDI
jgi:hypothetical protein